MKERDLNERFLSDHILAARAFAAVQLNTLPDHVRARVNEAIRRGSGRIELRTDIETGRTELVLEPSDGSDALWLTSTPAPLRG